jgi:hypothetical protein
MRVHDVQLGPLPVRADECITAQAMCLLGRADELHLAQPAQVVLEEPRRRKRLIAHPERDIQIGAAVAVTPPQRAGIDHTQHVRVCQDALLEGRE